MKCDFVKIILSVLSLYVRWCHAVPNAKETELLLDGSTATIPLTSYKNLDSSDQAFTQFTTFASASNFTIDITNIPPIVSFIIVQVHTYQYNVTLSYDKMSLDKISSKSIYGTNLGLMIDTRAKLVAHVFVRNDNMVEVKALLAVVAYTSQAPIPGGCNMEFNVEIAPFQKLLVNEATVVVDVQSASAPATIKGTSCERYPVHHETFHMYLPEQDFSTETYFSALTSMLTVRDTLEHGKQTPASVIASPMRRVYSAYPGTGSVYGVVATYGNYSAAYVPTFTYACSPLFWTDTCQVLTTSLSKLLCAIVLFLGFFVTFLGQRYFKTELFLLGCLSGGLVSYVVAAIVGNYSSSGNIGVSLAFGCLTGLGLLGLWWFYGIPVLSILLATLTLGFFWACVVYFSIPDGLTPLEDNVNFWLVFIFVILTVPLTLSIVPLSANIISCAILGSYAVIIPIDYYVGSNLKYIIINTMRRATVPGFNLAIIHPPYQSKDISLTLFWIFLAVLGVYVQLKRNRGKPPFPPAASILPSGRDLPSERTPLLVSSRIPIVTVSEDDDVFYSPNHRWFNVVLKKLRIRRRNYANA